MAPLTFHPGEIRVFDRAGAPLGSLVGWSVDQPRSFRLSEVEDFTISIPQRDEATATTYLTDDVVNNLLREDNHVYLANQMYGMRGWGGVIRSVTYAGHKATVQMVGHLSLLNKLATEVVEQADGYVWTIASRLVSAANAKQGPHGDLVMGFVHDETAGKERRNYGSYIFEGDILSGLQQLANQSLSEFFAHSRIRPDGSLSVDLRWGGRYVIDHTDIVLSDEEGGALLAGTEVTFTSSGAVNRARLKGTPTNLGEYMDYDSVRGVVADVTPECELTFDEEGDFHRRREELDLSVGFGYSTETEQALAAQVQELYLGYYKSFCYAYHNHMGRPFLDGYDWPGPNGKNDKRLTAHYGRTYSRMAYIGTKTVIVGDSDDDDESTIEARFDDWRFSQTLSLVDQCVGVTTNWVDPDTKFIADSTTGNVYELDEDLTTLTLWQHVTASGETLKSITTDAARATVLWVLVTTGSSATVRMYDASEKVVLSSWTIPVPTANDISADPVIGVMWLVAADGVGDVQARDINSGSILTGTTYTSFASGFANPKGLSMSGGLAYIIDGSGNVRFLFVDDGNFAGSKATGVPADGLFVDQTGGLVWVIKTDGDLALYHAHIAIATAGGDGIVEGAPGFERISTGRFVHVVFNTDTAATPHTKKKLYVTYSPGRYITSTVQTSPGEPNALQRTWVTGEQKSAWIERKKLHWTTPEQIVQGEESRVDDWNPKEDGYGYYGKAVYKTKRGHAVRFSSGWHFKDWDVPDTTFQPDPPEWTEGLAYLQEYLARQNKRRPVQVLRVHNVGSLFSKIVLGGEYTVRVTKQGPPGGFPDAVFRVLAYTPDERQGVMELIGEWM